MNTTNCCEKCKLYDLREGKRQETGCSKSSCPCHPLEPTSMEKIENEFDKEYRCKNADGSYHCLEFDGTYHYETEEVKNFFRTQMRELVDEATLKEHNEHKDDFLKGGNEFLQTISENLPKLKDHVCRFNDGEQECDCYKSCLEDVTNLIKNLK